MDYQFAERFENRSGITYTITSESGVGEPLFTKFKEASIDAIATKSSVCSIQLFEGTSIQVYHPLQLLCFQ
ncbi:MAG: hypothetical protein HKP41_05210 [Desulfobacterales bacterium]|nr:hypothetical protein [Desulfobacterales bacterium]